MAGGVGVGPEIERGGWCGRAGGRAMGSLAVVSSRGYPGTAPPLSGAVSAYPLLLPLPPKIPPKTWGKTPPLRVGAYALLKCPFMRIFRAYSRKIVQGGLGKNPPNLANIGRTI